MTSRLPIVLSNAAFQVLTSDEPRPMPDAKDPGIPVMTFQQSSCGLFYYYIDDEERFAVITVPPVEGRHDGYQLTMFYRKMFSNFARIDGAVPWEINGRVVDYKIAEQVFKAACVAVHMDPTDETSDKAVHLLKVLESVMSATSPKKCKDAPRAIPKEDFQHEKWDTVSFDVMKMAQLWKCTDPKFYNLMQLLGQKAREYSIKPTNCYIFEAAGVEDELWGCGPTVAELYNSAVSNMHNETWAFPMKSPVPFTGQNKLGMALNESFLDVVGKDGEFIGRPIEDYRALFTGAKCELFVCAPASSEESPSKRARSMSDSNSSAPAEVEQDAACSFGRTPSFG